MAALVPPTFHIKSQIPGLRRLQIAFIQYSKGFSQIDRLGETFSITICSRLLKTSFSMTNYVIL